MKTSIITILALSAMISSSNALYLCLYNGALAYSGGDSSYDEPDCLAQHGTSSSDCYKRGVDGALIGVKCSIVIDSNTHEAGGFWATAHNINYKNKNGVHYYCNPGHCGDNLGGSCGCDAGDGVPPSKA